MDFAHFLWKYNEEFNFLKRAIIAFPIHGRVRILYVQHHRARSDGWFTTVLCDTCARDERFAIREKFGCSLYHACKCAVCVRQPPTLKATAAHVVFDMLLNLERFSVTDDELQPLSLRLRVWAGGVCANRTEPNRVRAAPTPVSPHR